MKAHKSTAVIAGIAVAAIALAACGSSGGGNKGGGGSGSSSGSGTLTFGESTDYPENLLPLIAAGNATSVANLEARTLDGAFRISPDIKYIPDTDQLANTPESKLVNGQQQITYKINPKAVWDDGKPITAADYIFTWNTQKSSDPKSGGCASLLSTTGYDQIQSVTSTDDHTVVVTFKKGQNFPDWQSLFSPILSKHVFDKGSAAATCAYITKGWPIAQGIPAGASNGPWLISKIDTQKKTEVLSHNPKYWGAAPKLKNIIDAYIGSDSNTNVNALKNQEVGMIYPQPQLDLVGNLSKLSGVTTAINFGVSFEHLDFNTKDPLLGIKAVRQAIAYAIDRPALVSATVGKFSDKASVLGNRIVLSNQQGYEDHSGGYAHQNIAKAKQLLESAGAKMGSDGIYTINGKPLSFVVSTTQNNPLRDTTVATIAAQVKAAGIKITEFQDPDIFADKSKPHSLEAEGFQIALFAWVGGPGLSSNRSIYYTKSKGGGQNYTQISNPQIDSALDKMATSLDITQETKYANQADSLLWDQMATLPLFQKPTLLAYSNNYKGIGDNATQAGPLWNSDTFTQTGS